jgi:hypothetical protein
MRLIETVASKPDGALREAWVASVASKWARARGTAPPLPAELQKLVPDGRCA